MWKRFKCRQLLLVLLVLVLTLAVSNCGKESASVDKQSIKEFDISVYQNNNFLITPQQLHSMLDSENLVLLDCNNPSIYAKEHIPGAIGIGLQGFCDIVGKPGDSGWGTIKDKEDLQKTLASLGIDREKTVVFYSDLTAGPGADGRAVWQLKMAGMDNVKMLVGGSTSWKELGYPTAKEVTQPKPVSGVVLQDYDQRYLATKDYVFDNLGKKVIIDCRTEGNIKVPKRPGNPVADTLKGRYI